MSSATITDAEVGLRDAFLGAGTPYLVDDSGDRWIREFFELETFPGSGVTRLSLLEKDDARLQLRKLFGRIRQYGPAFLREAALTRRRLEVDGKEEEDPVSWEPTISAPVMASFQELLAELGTPWCS